MKIDQNWPTIKSCPLDKILHQKAIGVFEMTKITSFSEKFAFSGSFDEKTSKVG